MENSKESRKSEKLYDSASYQSKSEENYVNININEKNANKIIEYNEVKINFNENSKKSESDKNNKIENEFEDSKENLNEKKFLKNTEELQGDNQSKKLDIKDNEIYKISKEKNEQEKNDGEKLKEFSVSKNSLSEVYNNSLKEKESFYENGNSKSHF